MRIAVSPAAEEEGGVVNMDDTGETGEFKRVLKLELGAVPRYFARFSHAHLKLNLILVIWILHL